MPSSQQPSSGICRTIYFTGRVQGVGFRFTAYHVARQFAVAGYARNLPDGRVEVVADGQAPEVDRFVEAIRREMGGLISGVDARDRPSSGEFDRFEIRF